MISVFLERRSCLFDQLDQQRSSFGQTAGSLTVQRTDMVKGSSFLSFMALGIKRKEVTFQDADGVKEVVRRATVPLRTVG